MSKKDEQEQEVRVELDQLLQAASFIAKSQRQPLTQKEQNWVDRAFSSPRDLSDFLGRLSWSIVVPAMGTLIYLPLAQWGWVNGYPMIVIVVSLSVVGVYWLTYQAAIKSAASKILSDSVNFWMAVPAGTVFFVLVWELLKP